MIRVAKITLLAMAVPGLLVFLSGCKTPEVQAGGVPVSVHVYDDPLAPGQSTKTHVELTSEPLTSVKIIYERECGLSQSEVFSDYKDVIPASEAFERNNDWFVEFNLTVNGDLSRDCLVRIGAKTNNTDEGTLEPGDEDAGTLHIETN